MSNGKIAAILLAFIILAAVLWTYQRSATTDEAPIVDAPAAGASETAEPPVEKYPVPTISPSKAADLIELPALADSDAYFKLELSNLVGDSIDTLLRESGGIERFVATVDNLPRRRFAERLRLLDGPSGSLQVVSSDDALRLDESNYERYAPYLKLLQTADTDEIVSAYRRFYPLMQEAYVKLGYPNGFFNDRLVEVIDDLLATPVPESPPQLVRPHVLYQFADPELEKLSAGQKILIRMGPQNAVEVKDRLREIRERIVNLG